MQVSTNHINYGSHGTHYDPIKVSPGTLSALRFMLKGTDGKVVSLQGAPWPFSLAIYEE